MNRSIEDFGFEPQEAELHPKLKITTSEPKSNYRRHLYFMEQNLNVEKVYYYMIDLLKDKGEFFDFDKITDTFTSSESSSYWGTMQQRLGIQQDKLASYLQSIGVLLKELITIVKDLRTIKEKLRNYENSMPFEKLNPDRYKKLKEVITKDKNKESDAAEVLLKGYWIDFVEGGGNAPGSVYGLAKQFNYAALPTLFFSIHPTKLSEIDSLVDDIKYNKAVRIVLKRKLRAYLNWKIHTHDELMKALEFSRQYLKQHFYKIKMYIEWLKPYLKAVKNMTPNADKMDDVELISSFESSILELEFLAKKESGEKDKDGNEIYECILVTMISKTTPQLAFQGKEYGKNGPIHLGSIDVTMNAYSWTKEDIKNFKKYRAYEDFQILGEINNTIKTTIESLGDELKDILREEDLEELEEIAGPEKKPEKTEKEKRIEREIKRRSSPFYIFESLIYGFLELLKVFNPDLKNKKLKEKKESSKEDPESKVDDHLSKTIKDLYEDTKKYIGALKW